MPSRKFKHTLVQHTTSATDVTVMIMPRMVFTIGGALDGNSVGAEPSVAAIMTLACCLSGRISRWSWENRDESTGNPELRPRNLALSGSQDHLALRAS